MLNRPAAGSAANSDARGDRRPTPSEIIERICSHVTSRAALCAILLTSWAGYGAAMPFLYVEVETDNVGGLAAGLLDPWAGPVPTSSWPSEASHERKRRALAHVERLCVRSWLTPVRNSPIEHEEVLDEDVSEEEAEAREKARFKDRTDPIALVALGAISALEPNPFPRLRGVVFHAGVVAGYPPIDDWEGGHDVSKRVMRSALYDFLSTLTPQYVCLDVGAHKPPLTFLVNLTGTWEASSSVTVTLHSLQPGTVPLSNGHIPATRVRLWPGAPSRRLRAVDTYSATETPWQYNLDDWENTIDVLADRSVFHGHTCEIVGCGPTAPLTCTHAAEYAASAFYLRVMVQMQLEDWEQEGVEFHYAGAAEPCAACGRHPPPEAWYSAPLGEALGPEYAEIVGRMRALDTTLPPPPDGPCVSTVILNLRSC